MKTEKHGWVMVDRKNPEDIMDFSFHYYRRDAVGEMVRMFPRYSRQQALRRWKPVKAVRTITLTEQDDGAK